MDIQPDVDPVSSPPRPRLLWYLLYSLVPLSLLAYSLVVLYPRPSPIEINELSATSFTPIVIPGSLLDTGIKAENFTDVDRGSWSWKYIQQISPLGIIPPKTSTEFDPQGLVSRLDMARFLLKTYELITKNSPAVVPTTFTDLTELSQADQDIVAKIYGLKVTAGTSATTFSPSDPVNRAQMVTFISSLYKAVTGDFPPEVDVPFTDIYDPDLEWSVKYIKKTYNLKITAGTTATTFSPRDNVTREQMATFIFSFMRLFGPSYNDSNLTQELSNLKSVVYGPPWEEYKIGNYANLKNLLPEIKTTGFNTIWMINNWKTFNPSPLANPPVYNDAAFADLTQTLDLLRQNNMKAIIGLNYLIPEWSPEGIDACRYTVDLPMYQSFETYVSEFLRRIENYSDIVYPLLFTEGAEPCGRNTYNNAKEDASILRSTLGSLPQRLNPQLRNKFKIGYHDYSLINHNWAGRESPIQMPLSYDFLSGVNYHEAKIDQEIIDTLDNSINNFKTIYPFTPVIIGEFGVVSCNISNPNSSYNSSPENQARLLKIGIQHLLSQNIGFSIWQWEGKYSRAGDACLNYSDKQVVTPASFGLAYYDTFSNIPPVSVSKPARVEIQKLLNPSAPAPQCVEQASPTFAQKIIDQNHKLCQSFTSACVPPGWSVVPGITNCKQACTGELVWVRLPELYDGSCGEVPVPRDCIPFDPDRGPSYNYTIDDTCRPGSSPTPYPYPTPKSSTKPSPSPLPQPTLLPKTSALPSPTTASQTQADTPESPQLTTASPTSLLDRAIDAIQAVKAFLTRLTFPTPSP